MTEDKYDGIRKKFGMYDGVKGRNKTLKVSDEDPVEVIVEYFDDFLKGFDPASVGERIYSDAWNAIHDVNYSKKDIERFVSYELLDNEDYYAHCEISGIFVSAVINKLLKPGDTIELDYSNAAFMTDALGFKSKGLVYKIIGDSRNFVGAESKDCIFDIAGSVGEMAGKDSKNSTFNIDGNADRKLGEDASDCTFNVSGDVDDGAGIASVDCTFNIKCSAGMHLGRASVNSVYKAQSVESHPGYHAHNCKFDIEKGPISFAGVQATNCEFNVNNKRIGFLMSVGEGTEIYKRRKIVYPKRRHLWVRNFVSGKWITKS